MVEIKSSKKIEMDTNNPLLMWDKASFPDFRSFDEKHLLPALSYLEKKIKEKVKEVTSEPVPITWNSRYLALEKVVGEFENLYGLVMGAYYLNPQKYKGWDTQSLEAYQKIDLWLRRNRSLASSMKVLLESGKLTKKQKTWLEDKSLNGFGSEARETAALGSYKKQLVLESHKLCETFKDNIKESLSQSAIWAQDRASIKGISSSWLRQAKERAVERGVKGWVFLPEAQEYMAFMQECENREMRRLMYRARSQAASEKVGEEHDNSRIGRRILAIRKEQAQMDGFDTYAKACLNRHMVKTPEEVETFLTDMATKVLPLASEERKELSDWMRDKEAVKRLEPWDYRYASACLKAEKMGHYDSEAAAYFSVVGCIERSVSFMAKVMHCEVQRQKKLETIDHLMIFEFKRQKETLGHIGVSPFVNEPGNEGGAFEFAMRFSMDSEKTLPCTLVFLQMQKQARMDHSEVVVLFHELGHAMQTLLAKPKDRRESVNLLEWDAVETYSQFFENLAWEPETLKFVGRKKGNPMPNKTINGLIATRNFHAGANLISDITEALCDLRLHNEFNPKGRLQTWEMLQITRNEIGFDSAKPYNRQGNQSTFLPSKYYACAGYSYLWSYSLAAQLLEQWKVESKGKIIHKKTALHFEQSMMAPAAKKPTLELFKHYTHSTPVTDAFLRLKGLSHES